MEATVRFAAELGYEVTVVKDATASYSLELIAVSLLNGVVYGLLPTAYSEALPQIRNERHALL